VGYETLKRPDVLKREGSAASKEKEREPEPAMSQRPEKKKDGSWGQKTTVKNQWAVSSHTDSRKKKNRRAKNEKKRVVLRNQKKKRGALSEVKRGRGEIVLLQVPG